MDSYGESFKKGGGTRFGTFCLFACFCVCFAYVLRMFCVCFAYVLCMFCECFARVLRMFCACKSAMSCKSASFALTCSKCVKSYPVGAVLMDRSGNGAVDCPRIR